VQASPVWQQIIEHCQRKGWCEAVFQHSQGLRTQLATQEQQLEEKVQQLMQKEQQLADQQRQLAEQAAELAALRASLAARQRPA
jgi:peptidoglycan hydrolase CwlO-like protein